MVVIAPIWAVFFFAAGITGVVRGYPLAGWVLGFFLGPIGLVIIALSGNMSKRPVVDSREMEAGNKIAKAKSLQERAELKSGLVKCCCGEMIPRNVSCPFCGAVSH